MTIAAADLWLYVLALAGLFLTPGPVWVAMMARALSGGFRAAWPLALGVALGDILWPLLAILGVGWIVSVFSSFLIVLRWVACAMFVGMGILVIRQAGAPIRTDGRLTRPGLWAGFAAGVAVIIGNPKAILFYMGILPGFFDVGRLSWPDIAAICAASVAVPLAGNLALSALIGRARMRITAPGALRRITLGAGALLIVVGLVLPFV